MPSNRNPTPPAIRPCAAGDAVRISAIYDYYVRQTIVTFEEQHVTPEQMSARIADAIAQYPWLVAERDGAVVGYAYATEWKPRSAYRFAVESTVYLAADCTGRGVGSALYAALVAELRRRDVHSVIGGIALPNAASVALHEKLGFAKIGVFREVGFKLGRWIDVGYWELLL